LLFSSLAAFTQAPKLQWMKRWGNNGASLWVGTSTTDEQDNIYLTVLYKGTIVLDGYTFIAGNTGNNLAQLKLNPNGLIVDTTNIKATTTGSYNVNSNANSLIVRNGYVYNLIYPISTTILIKGHSIPNTGLSDVLLYKSDTNGNYIWCKNIVYDTSPQVGFGINIDANDNIIINGYFTTSATFYGGAIILSSTSTKQQPFIAKLDTSGNVLWAKHIPCSSNVTASATYNSGISDNSYYFTGLFADSLKTDVDTLISYGAGDMFLYATDYDGNGKWVRQIGGLLVDQQLTIKVHDNLIYFAGNYQSATLTIDSTSTLKSVLTLPNAGTVTNDIIYGQYDTSGTLQFVKRYGSVLADTYNNDFYVKNGLVKLGIQYGANIDIDGNLFTISGTANTVQLLLKDNVCTKYFMNLVGTGTENNIRLGVVDSHNNYVVNLTTNSNPYVIDGISYARVGSVRDIVIAKYSSPYKALKTGKSFLKVGNNVINYK